MTATASRTFVSIAKAGAGLLCLAAPLAALAHHAHDYAPPENALQGLLSGLAHPILSLPHLVALLVIGLLAAGQAKPSRLVGTFCFGSALMAFMFAIGLQGWPGHDAWVALSLALGGLWLWKQRAEQGLAGLAGITAIAIAGSIHGQIAAESIETTQMTILAAYWAGIVTAQFAIAQVVRSGWLRLARRRTGFADTLRLGGALLSTGVAITVLLGAG